MKVVFVFLCLCITINTAGHSMESIQEQTGKSIVWFKHESFIEETKNLIKHLTGDGKKETTSNTVKLSNVYENYENKNNDQNIILKYLKQKETPDNTIQYYESPDDFIVDNIVKRLNKIINYYNYLLNSLFYEFFMKHGKIYKIDCLIKQDIQQVIKHVELHKNTNNEYSVFYKKYGKNNGENTENENIFKTVSETIQQSAVECIRNFYNNNKGLSEKYFKKMKTDFSKLIEQYNTFSCNKNDILNKNHLKSISNSKAEQVAHALYLDKTISEFIANRDSSSNHAYATISTDCKNTNTVLILDGEEKKETEKVGSDKIRVLAYYNNDRFKSFNSIKKKNINTFEYSFDKLFSISNLKKCDESFKQMILAYACFESSGRALIKDDEFKILCCLFQNIDEIVTSLLSNLNNQTNNITIDMKLFTYMDMCPSCWTAWNECFDNLKKVYQNKISHEIEVNINVYSIKPYVISDNHPFVSGISEKSNNKMDKSDVRKIDSWYDMSCRNSIRQSVIKFNNTNNNITQSNKTDYHIKQIVDLEGVNILRKMDDTINYLIEPIKDVLQPDSDSIDNNSNSCNQNKDDDYIDIFNCMELECI